MNTICQSTQLDRPPEAAGGAALPKPADTPSDLAAQAIARHCNYGIAIVFSLMLVVLAVIGSMLLSG